MGMYWRIQEHLDAKGWTAYRLAKEAGLTPSTVYKLLKKDELRHVDTATLEAIGRALKLRNPLTLLEFRDE